jgi:hypothetical protein
MTKVNLPPGCTGFDCKDGTRITADRPGGAADLDDRQTRAVKASQFAGDGQLIGNVGRVSFGTSRGQKCTNPECRRIWNAWNDVCPRCGDPTTEWYG